MAEYSRGQDNRENDHSVHNNNGEKNLRGRMWGVDLDAVNYEQRRPPYGSSKKDSGKYDNAGSANGSPGGMREDV